MARPPASYEDLNALYINCTLKRTPRTSHTEGLMKVSQAIMEKQGVDVAHVRLVDHDIARGVQPDMTGEGWDKDDWPQIWEKVQWADILVVGTPIWLGEESSVARTLIERLYAHSGELNEAGQFVYYGKTGGCVITGNEDGIKHCSMTLLYAMQHIGFTIPPNADCGWIGEAGPGKSYLDEGSGGPENDFTRRNTTFMTWNLMHMARMLKDAGGVPAHGNQVDQWRGGERFGHPAGD